MFALSRDGEKFFLHQPDAGMVVPVLLDLKSKTLAVRVPSIDELEHDYAVYDELSDVLDAVGKAHFEEVSFARKFSQEYSRTFRDQIETGTLTVSELRGLVESHFQRAVGHPPMASRSTAKAAETFPEGYSAMVADFKKSFTSD